MRTLSFSKAIREALEEEMRRDKEVILFGEDIKYDPWGVTVGIHKEFGEERVLHAPISENGFVSAGVGAALAGMRPGAHLLFADFIPLAADAIGNQAAKFHYFNGGQICVPLTVRVAGTGGGKGAASHHSQSLEPLMAHFPGLKIAVPATPSDAKGLLKTAIRDNNPVLFFESKQLYSLEGPVPSEELLIPFGKAEIMREGKDITVATYSIGVHKTLQAAEQLNKEGIEVEVINLRTLRPLDTETIMRSLAKTNRFAVVEDCYKFLGMGAELLAIVAEEGLQYLEAPARRIAAKDVPIPGSRHGEQFVLPTVERIFHTIKELFALEV